MDSLPSSRSQPMPGEEKTTLYYRGYKYTKANKGSSKSQLYRCSYRRRKNRPCDGAMVLCAVTGSFKMKKMHSCRDDDSSVTGVKNVVEAMLAMVDGLALTDLTLTPTAIWSIVHDKFYANDDANVLKGITQQQAEKRAYNIRQKHFGQDEFGLIERPPLSLVLKTERNFFQFHYVTGGKMTGSKPRRIIGWADPELIELLYDKKVFVIMALEHRSGIYAPVYYILTTDRSEDTYFDALHMVFQSTSQKLDPGEIVCDFESALIRAVGTQFRDSTLVGCLFHFKQASKRRMRHLGIPKRQIKIAMAVGCLDMLTVIEREKILSYGIAWVIDKIRTECDEHSLDYAEEGWYAFWSYFRATWIKRYPPELWNIHGLSKALVLRTNNPLERFNRELNKAMAPHPKLAVFVSTVSKLAAGHARRLQDVRKRRASKMPRDPVVFRIPKAIEFETDGSDEGVDGDFSSDGDDRGPGNSSGHSSPDELDTGFDYDGTPEPSEGYSSGGDEFYGGSSQAWSSDMET